MDRIRVAFVSPVPEFSMIVKNDVLKIHSTIDHYTGSSVTYREPIGLEYVEGYVNAKASSRYECRLFSETFMDAREMLKFLMDYGPNFVAVSVHSAVVYPDTVLIASELKKARPDVKIALGGYHPTGEIMEYTKGNLEKTLLHGNIDAVIFGEGEESFLEWMDALVLNKPLDNIRGIAYKKDGRIKVNLRRPRVNFVSLPWASRHEEVLKFTKCAPLAYPPPHKQRAAQISSSRGCPYGCDFCSSMTIWPAKKDGHFGRCNGEMAVQYRDPADFAKEAKWLKDEFNVNFFTLTDLTFNANHTHAQKVCQELLAQGVTKKPNGVNDVGWFAYATVDKTVENPRTIEIMAEAGCSRIGIGIESLHGTILQEHKPTHNNYCKGAKALRIVNENGILNRTYLMVGWPDETPEMFDETKEILLSGELPVDQLRLAFVVPFLGTPLYGKYKDRLLTKDWRRFTGDEPVIRNDYMSPDEMKERVKDMMMGYYASDAYRNHISEKVRAFPHLRESFEYWNEFLQKRGIIPMMREVRV